MLAGAPSFNGTAGGAFVGAPEAGGTAGAALGGGGVTGVSLAGGAGGALAGSGGGELFEHAVHTMTSAQMHTMSNVFFMKQFPFLSVVFRSLFSISNTHIGETFPVLFR